MNPVNKSARLKGSILLAALIVSSYVLTTGATAHYDTAFAGADGNAIFLKNCSICHGKDGRGTPNWRKKGQPDFTDANWHKSRTDAQIFEVTKNGKPKFMPAYKSKLSDEEITAVVARVRAFGKK